MNTNDIKLSLSDRVVGLFSAKKLEQRVRAKEASRGIDIAMRSLFKSAETNRTNADWTVPQSVDINKVLATELSLIRARSRWLMINNADAKAAQNAMCNYIIGTGFDLQMNVASVQRTNDGAPIITEFESFNAYVEDVHKTWTRDIYLTTPKNGPMSFYEFQVMAMERWIQDGEVFIHMVPSTKDIMRLEFVEPEALDIYRTSGDNDNPVVMGVEIDKNTQQPVAYWISKAPIDRVSTYSSINAVRVPADKIIHAYIRKYPRQLRGIPWMSAVIERLNQTDGYRNAQLIRNKIAAFFGILFTGDGVTGRKMFDDDVVTSGGTNFPVDANGNPITNLAPGMMGSLPPNVRAEKIDPTSPETSYHDFMKSLLSSSAAGMEFGLSYQLMSRDTSGMSYAGGRLTTQMDTQAFRQCQKMFTQKILSPLHYVWMEYAVLSGKLESESYSSDPMFWSQHDWLPSGWSFGVNPVQEVEASKASMSARMTSLIDECSKIGLDWKSQLRKAKKVNDYANSLGVSLEYLGGSAKASVSSEESEEQVESGENVWLM